MIALPVLCLLVACLLSISFLVRPAIIAGSWYPGKPAQLTADIKGYLQAADPGSQAGRPRALISPHAGFLYSGQCAAYAYRLLQGQTYQRVVLIGPRHEQASGGVWLADYDAFETPLGEVPVDGQACRELAEAEGPFVMDRANHARERNLEIQLPFLQHVLGSFKLVPLILQGVDPNQAGDVAAGLARIIDDQTLVVVSSDFTHYGAPFGYLPFTTNVLENLEKLDLGAARFIEQGDLEGFVGFCDKHRCTICGREPITVVMSLAKKIDLGTPRVVHYSTSAGQSGDTSHVVSYVAMGYFSG